MKTTTKIIISLFSILSIFFLHSNLNARIITSKGGGINGDWYDQNTWAGGIIPTDQDTVEIQSTDIIYFDVFLDVFIVKKLHLKSEAAIMLGDDNWMIVLEDLKLDTDAVINFTSLSFLSVIGNIINDGQIFGVDGWLSAGQLGGKDVTVTNNGIIGLPDMPLDYFNVFCNTTIDKKGDSIYAASFYMPSGKLTNAAMIVIGDMYHNAEIDLGNQPNYSNPVLDTFLSYNSADIHLRIEYYDFKSDYTMGYEIPSNRTVNEIYLFSKVANTCNVILNGGDLKVNAIYFGYGKNSNIGSKKIILGKYNLSSKYGFFYASKTNGYVVTNGTGFLQGDKWSDMFPVGADTNSYDPVYFKFYDKYSNPFSVRVGGPSFIHNPTDTSSVVKREWFIKTSFPENSEADVTFNYDESAPRGKNYNEQGNLVVGTYSNGRWMESPVSPNDHTIYVNNFDANTSFIIGNANALLPLQFISFNGSRRNKDIELNWVVANEINNKKFEVERSTGGITFNVIATISAKNNNNSGDSYSFIDKQPIGEILYYRLKQIDINGKYSYSKIITVKGNNENLYSIYSNPVKDKLTITSTKPFNHKVRLTIYNISGNKVYDNTTDFKMTKEINVFNLLPGAYTLNIKEEQVQCSIRFIRL